MKKTFALILALVMVAFAFASCGPKKPASTTAGGTTPASTTAETECNHVWGDFEIDTPATCTAPGSKSKYCTICNAQDPTSITEIPQLDHTPADEYTIDSAPNCTDGGFKSKHCTVCGLPIADTVLPVDPDPTKHNVENWTVTEEVNMLNQTGSRTGVCTLCHRDVVEDVLWEGPIIKAFNANSGRYGMAEVKIDDVRGDKHFYPTDEDLLGNDLYVEFSILWNETVLNFDGANDGNTKNDPYMVGRFYDGKPFYYLSPVPGMDYSDAKFSGAFEWMGNFGTPISDGEVTTPATMCGGNPNYTDYPNIAGTDEAHPEYGWHRFGIRYHLELLEGKTGEKLEDYVGIATGFVDGVAIFKLSTGTDGMQNWQSMLFKAESDGEGGVVYSDAGDVVIPFLMNKSNTKADTVAYLAFSDVYVTCGKDFVMQVEKVASPEAATLEVAEGVNIPAPVYFKLAD